MHMQGHQSAAEVSPTLALDKYLFIPTHPPLWIIQS